MTNLSFYLEVPLIAQILEPLSCCKGKLSTATKGPIAMCDAVRHTPFTNSAACVVCFMTPFILKTPFCNFFDCIDKLSSIIPPPPPPRVVKSFGFFFLFFNRREKLPLGKTLLMRGIVAIHGGFSKVCMNFIKIIRIMYAAAK